MKKIAPEFYQRQNVVTIAKELIGKVLVTKINKVTTAGIIVETEAYAGIIDKASHSYKNKCTLRNEVMYASGGIAYVYICYGMHNMFNVVTNNKNNPDAILIRAVEPLQGIQHMCDRTNKSVNDYTISKGPGNVCKAMGITKEQNTISLTSSIIYIADDNIKIDTALIKSSKRIGINYAQEAIEYPYRFYVEGNKYVSGKPR